MVGLAVEPVLGKLPPAPEKRVHVQFSMDRVFEEADDTRRMRCCVDR
jgi:hypothetical protein